MPHDSVARRPLVTAFAPVVAPVSQKGPIMLIGGAEYHGEKDKPIDKDRLLVLGKFAEMTAPEKLNSEKKIAIVPTASRSPGTVFQDYVAAFVALGFKEENIIRVDADGDVSALDNVDSIFITGGNQQLLVHDDFSKALACAHANGILIGGTSAGAMCMANKMLWGDETHNNISEGLGLIPYAVIETHYDRPARPERRGPEARAVVAAAWKNRSAIIIPENTAVIIHPDEKLEVVGRGNYDEISEVVIIDRRNYQHAREISLRHGEGYDFSNGQAYVLDCNDAIHISEPPEYTYVGAAHVRPRGFEFAH